MYFSLSEVDHQATIFIKQHGILPAVLLSISTNFSCLISCCWKFNYEFIWVNFCVSTEDILFCTRPLSKKFQSHWKVQFRGKYKCRPFLRWNWLQKPIMKNQLLSFKIWCSVPFLMSINSPITIRRAIWLQSCMYYLCVLLINMIF